jgi:hypothetical protein
LQSLRIGFRGNYYKKGNSDVTNERVTKDLERLD